MMGRARNFAKEALERIEAEEKQTTIQMPPAPEIVTREIPIPAMPTTVELPPPDAVPQPAYVPPPAPAPTFQPPAVPPQELERLQREKDDLMRQLEIERISRKADLLNQERLNQDLMTYKSQFEEQAFNKELEEAIKFDPDEFEAATAGDAQKIAKAALAAATKKQQEQIKALETRIAEQQQQFAQYVQAASAAAAKSQSNKVDQEILSAHPDFTTLIKNPDFISFIDRPFAPGVKTTVRQVMAQEINLGNSKFIIDSVNQYKTGKPRLEDVAQVSSVAVGSVDMPPPPSPHTGDTPDPLLDQVRRGVITRAQYRAELQKNKTG